MPTHVRFFVLALGLLSAVALRAQSMLVSEPLTIRNDFGYEIIGRLNSRVLLFRDKYDEFEVQAYDAQMRLAWSKDLEDLDRKGVQILAVVGGRNDFSLIHKVRRRGTVTLRLHKYDPNAALIDSMQLKNYGDRLFNIPTLKVVSSDDRNCIAVFNTAEQSKLEITCFRLDKMQVLWDKTIQLRDDRYIAEDLREAVLSNNGELFLAAERFNRRGRIEDHEFEIVRISAGSEALVRVPAGEFLTNDVKFAYDNKYRRLVGAGLYADKNRDRANGTFLVTLNQGAGTAELRTQPFDEKFLSVLRRKEDDAAANRGIDDATARQVVLRQDGGVVLVAERFREIQRGAAAGRGFFRDGMRMVIDFFYDDVFIVSMNPDGHTQWNTVLHKKQYSQDDEGTFSSFFLVRNADKIRFLFNDEIKYENTCSEYILTPTGHFDRNSLLTTFGQNLRLRFRDGLQLNAGECLIPSEYRGKLRLVLLHF